MSVHPISLYLLFLINVKSTELCLSIIPSVLCECLILAIDRPLLCKISEIRKLPLAKLLQWEDKSQL